MSEHSIAEDQVSTLEIKRSKRLKGQAALIGDARQGFQALMLAALAEGPSKLENLPDTPWFREALQAFIHLGYAQPALDGHWLIHGGHPPAAMESGEPLRIRHESDLLALAGFLSGQGVRRTLEVDLDGVSGDVLDLLGRIIELESPSGKPASSADGPSPGELESGSAPDEEGRFLRIIPGGLTGKAAEISSGAGSSPGRPGAGPPRPVDLGWDEYLSKLVLLAWHVSAGKPLDLSLLKAGPDLLESLAAQFGAPLKVDRNNEEQGDELARRIARQLRAAGKQEPNTRLRLAAPIQLKAQTYTLPADVTLTAALCLAATLLKGSDLTLEGVLLSPSRAGFIGALRRMGADIEVVSRRERQGETLGTLRVRSADLLGKRFGADNLSAMRDEIFLLMVAAAFAEGETIIRDVARLRRHRRDLLKSFAAALKSAGVEIGEIEDGLVIRGRADYDGAAYDCLGHPPLGLACLVMALKSHGTSALAGGDCLEASYPGLLDRLASLSAPDKIGADKAGPDKAGAGDKP